MNINPAAQGNSQGVLLPGNIGNSGVTGGGVLGSKPNPGSNIGGISQSVNSGAGNIGGQNLPPQNKDDKS